jgi:predicted metal-dependent hydrolase
MTNPAPSSVSPARPPRPRNPIVPRKVAPAFADVPRHWFGGNPVATHIANGVNLLCPQGERFFVRSVNHFLDRVTDPELRAQVRGFFGQEGRHASAHDDYNDHLRSQGYRIDRFLAVHDKLVYQWLEKVTPAELRLAATAAAEHYTAIMAEGAFTGDDFATAHPVMRELLLWHAAEEIEHKSVAFDVLATVNPSYRLRLAGLVYATGLLGLSWLTASLMLMRQDGLSLGAIRQALRALRAQAGREPIARRVFARGIREYIRRDFHPSDNDTYHLARDHFASRGAPAGAA